MKKLGRNSDASKPSNSTGAERSRNRVRSFLKGKMKSKSSASTKSNTPLGDLNASYKNKSNSQSNNNNIGDLKKSQKGLGNGSCLAAKVKGEKTKRISNDKENVNVKRKGNANTNRERSNNGFKAEPASPFTQRRPILSNCKILKRQSSRFPSPAFPNETKKDDSLDVGIDTDPDSREDDNELSKIYADSKSRDESERRELNSLEAGRNLSGRHCIPFATRPKVFTSSIQNHIDNNKNNNDNNPVIIQPRPQYSSDRQSYIDHLMESSRNCPSEKNIRRDPNSVHEVLPQSAFQKIVQRTS